MVNLSDLLYSYLFLNGNDGNNNNNNNALQLEFFVLPGETRQVQVKAMYAENPVEADPSKDILDVCLVEGPVISLADVAAAAAATQKAKQQQPKEDVGNKSSKATTTTTSTSKPRSTATKQ